MRETILALLALSIVTTMSIGIMSASLQNSIKQIDREIEVYASAVAAHVLDYAGSRSFDSRTTPNNWENFGEPADSTEFNLSSTFGSTPDCNLFEPYNDIVICDDMDDLHMGPGDWQPYDYVVEIVGTDTLVVPFVINTQVEYINLAYPDSSLSASVRTNTKKVTVHVKSLQHHQENLPGGSLTIERVFSYDRIAASAQSLAAVDVCPAGGGATLKVNRLLVPIYESLGGSAGPC